jgi:ADP-ribosylarginine hydrolase
MVKISEKIEASLMLASYFETLGFYNGIWEFNYKEPIINLSKYVSIWNTMTQHFIVLGGSSHINITKWNASDDTLLIIAIGNAIINNNDYISEYLNAYDLLMDPKRASGLNTIDTLKLLKKRQSIPISVTMGGNGAAMRTGPIGLLYYKDIERVIKESISSSILTHNYYLGFLGGMITAVFTSFGMNNIPAWQWVNKLIELYDNKIIHKYYPSGHNIEDLDEYMSYWKRYNETRISKLKYKNTITNFIYAENRMEYLSSFYPKKTVNWNYIATTGLDTCIYAYDCLLLSIINPDALEKSVPQYNLDTFIFLVCIHPGDNDTTAAIGGSWFGALNGYYGFDKDRIKELEFYKELLQLSKKIKRKL